MSPKRYEIKVGAFIFVGLVLLAVLVLLLSRGTTFRGSAIQLRLKSGNVGGIKAGANILLSGVSVGRVSAVTLDEDGRDVTILLSVYKKYRIYEDAEFSVEQLGFLGDQYVSIRSHENKGRQLQDGDEVICAKPFNMQEAVARATETISRIGQTATNVNSAVSDVRRYVLNEQTLKNLGASLDNFSLVTARALDAMSNLDQLVSANAAPITGTVSNLNLFSAELAPRVGQILSNSQPVIAEAMKNIQTASISLTNLMYDLESHKGLAGKLISDEKLAQDFSELARHLATVSSNLDQRGLWGIMWAKKTPKADAPATGK